MKLTMENGLDRGLPAGGDHPLKVRFAGVGVPIERDPDPGCFSAMQ